MTAPPSIDSEAFKLATRKQWDGCAVGWNDQTAQIQSWLREATDAMIEMAEVGPTARVLDVAAGAGDQTLDIAKRVGPNGYVLATDFSPVILGLARDNIRQAGIGNVEFKVADGEKLDLAEASFDAAVCRLGLMFLPAPAKGLHEMFHALKPGGRACTIVFSTPDMNPCVAMMVSTAFKHAGLLPRDPYQPGR